MNIKSTYENDKQKKFNEEQNSYSNEKLQTEKESIPINSTRDGVQQQNNQKQHHDYRKLDELSEGEFANTIRDYTNAPYFDFTSRTQKINNSEDVAYLFKNLQEEAIEHSFAVFVDDKNNFKAQWLGSGTPVGTAVDINAMIYGALHFENIKQVYFVHNHPSGRLTASKQDVDTLSKSKKLLNQFNINVQGIILNLNSGHYAIFDDYDTVKVKKGFYEKTQNEYKAEILSFSKQSFLQPPSTLTAVKTHQDTATFISQMRFGAAMKGGYLLLNNSNKINANFFYNYTNTTALAREIFLNAGRYASRGVILYGNNKQYNETLAKDFQSIITHSDINLLDVISISEPTHIVATTLAEIINENKDVELKSILLEDEATFSKAIENILDKKNITVNEAQNFLCEIHDSYNHQQAQNEEELETRREGFDFYDIIEKDKMLIEENIIIGGKIKDMAEMSISNPEYLQQFDKQIQDIINLFIQSKNLNMEKQDYKNNINADSNPLTSFNSDSDYFKFITDNKLEENKPAIEAVLQYSDNLNNIPQKPNSKDYFSNDFIEDNLPALERYEKDLLEYAINFKEAKQKLATSAEELWKYNIDPIGVPHNINLFIQSKNLNTMVNEQTLQTEKNAPQVKNTNLDYLENQILYTGFKFSPEEKKELEKKLIEKVDNFSINLTPKEHKHSGGVDATINYQLNFQKSKEGDILFFNNYTAKLNKNENGQIIKREQNFVINNAPKAKNITALEAFNLLDGRFINKDLTNKTNEKANYWIALDFDAPKNDRGNHNIKMFHENYGFDLKATLDKYPITNEITEQTINNLNKGSRIEMSMALNKDKNSSKVFVDVNPQMKALNLHDENGEKIFFNNTQSQKADVAETKEESKSRGVKM